MAPAESSLPEATAYCLLRILTCKRFSALLHNSYSVISTAEAAGIGRVCIKTYDRPSLVPKKQKMATREAIVLKYLNSMGWVCCCSRLQFYNALAEVGSRAADPTASCLHLRGAKQLQLLLAATAAKQALSSAQQLLTWHSCCFLQFHLPHTCAAADAAV
jgi:hypothetical protein